MKYLLPTYALMPPEDKRYSRGERAFHGMKQSIKAGFILKEDIVKVQHNCKATGFRVQKSKDYNFLLIMHEHLFVFQK